VEGRRKEGLGNLAGLNRVIILPPVGVFGMKLLAALPLVVVLVSICGAPAPASNSTISGVVFHDTNRNGVRDSCDRPLSNQGVVLLRESDRRDTPTDSKGSFSFSEVEGGSYHVRLAGSDGWQWPMTTAEPVVEVNGFSNAESVLLGSATPSQVDRSRPHLLSLVFEDVDGDGAVDPGECPFEDARVVGWHLVSDTGPSGQESGAMESLTDEFLGGGYAEPPPRGAWRQTMPDDPCARLEPRLAHGENIYEVTAGFTRDRREPGQLLVKAFFDSDADGERDGDESDVEAPYGAVTVNVYAGCADGRVAESNIDLGRSQPQLFSVAAGTYEVKLKVLRGGLIANGIRVVTTEPAVKVDIEPGGERTVEFGIKETTPSVIDLRIFEDVDADGVYDIEESGASGRICYELLLRSGGSPVYQNCVSVSSPTGLTRLELATGEYKALVAPEYWGCQRCPEAEIRFVVSDGENAIVEVPVNFADYVDSLEATPSGAIVR
jgi:SdrD B-like domain